MRTYSRRCSDAFLSSVLPSLPEHSLDMALQFSGGRFQQDFFTAAQSMLPVLGCPDAIRQLVYQTLQQARREQLYHTLLWELSGDNCLIDAIISDDVCPVYFDANGNISGQSGRIVCNCQNLFQSSLASIFADACPKKAKKRCHGA